MFWDIANGIQSTGTGAISITGTGGGIGGSGSANHGVYATAALTGGGAINITGTPSSSSGGGNYGISINSVAAGSGIITLTSTGAVTSSGALTAGGLRLLGAGGTYALTNAGNAVTTLAANTGTVNYAQTGNLTIGTVGATTGIAATGTVLVNVTGNLSLAAGTTVTAVGTGNALQLVDSGTFTNLAGAAALGVSGGGRWLVWSVNPATDNRGGLAYGFKQYGATYGVTTALGGTNNGFLYSTGATLTAGLTGGVSKVYDATNLATLAAGNYTLTGALDGDTIILNNPTAGTYDTANVAIGKTVTVTGLSITSASNGGAAVYGYTLASTTAAGPVGTIAAATLTYTADAASRTYGAANPAFGGTTTGFVGSDTLANATTGTASFTTLANAASNVGSYLISGAGLTANNGNYVFVQAAANATALTIAPANLTYTADAASRTYGAANPAFGGTVTGFVNGQTQATATTGTASFTTLATAASNVGSYLISGSGLTANNGNYVFVQAAANNNALTITPATLTYTADAASRIYGAANPALGGTTTGFVGSDTLANATTGTASFTTLANGASNVGSYLITGAGLTANNGNYVFVQAAANATALTISRGDPDLHRRCRQPDLWRGQPGARRYGHRLRRRGHPGHRHHRHPDLHHPGQCGEQRRLLPDHRLRAHRQQRQLPVRPGRRQRHRAHHQSGDADLYRRRRQPAPTARPTRPSAAPSPASSTGKPRRPPPPAPVLHHPGDRGEQCRLLPDHRLGAHRQQRQLRLRPGRRQQHGAHHHAGDADLYRRRGQPDLWRGQPGASAARSPASSAATPRPTPPPAP